MQLKVCQNMVKLKSWIAHLGNLNNQHYIVDGQGRCKIDLAKNSKVFIRGYEYEPHYCVDICLMELNGSDLLDIFSSALTINLFQRSTNGAAIAIDPAKDRLLLSKRCSYWAKDAESFAREIYNLVGASERINAQLCCEKTSHILNEPICC